MLNLGVEGMMIVGAIAGWLAGNLIRGGGFGLLGNIVVGIIGAVIGGMISSTLLTLVMIPEQKGQINGSIRIPIPNSELRVPVSGVVLRTRAP